jgi:hypothetical protein
MVPSLCDLSDERADGFISTDLCADQAAKPTLATAPCNVLAIRAPCVTTLPCSPWSLTGLKEFVIQQRCVRAVYIAYTYTQPTISIRQPCESGSVWRKTGLTYLRIRPTSDYAPIAHNSAVEIGYDNSR